MRNASPVQMWRTLPLREGTREGESFVVGMEGGEPVLGTAADGVDRGVVAMADRLDQALAEADLKDGSLPMGKHRDGGGGSEHRAKMRWAEGKEMISGVGAVGGSEVMVNDPHLDALGEGYGGGWRNVDLAIVAGIVHVRGDEAFFVEGCPKSANVGGTSLKGEEDRPVAVPGAGLEVGLEAVDADGFGTGVVYEGVEVHLRGSFRLV